MRSFIYLIFLIVVVSCNQLTDETFTSKESISDPLMQDSIFQRLMSVTDHQINEKVLNDSLAFLVLPLQASCPSCRKKTVDSIIKNYQDLAANHFIIISIHGGRKLINSYFLEQGAELPVMENRLFLDSLNLAAKLKLFDKRPTMYYAHGRKVYKKIASVPSTVKDDLHVFFQKGGSRGPSNQ